MKKIITLVDFTPDADIALAQAIGLAQTGETKIIICHIAGSGRNKVIETIKSDMAPYEAKVKEAGLDSELAVAYGDLYSEAALVVKKHSPDLVVVATHGKDGIRQHLFGSNIYKLVSRLDAPTLVVNENTKVVKGGFKRILLPVAPHADFMLKVRQTAPLIHPDGKVFIFAIVKLGVDLDEDIQRNINAAQLFFDNLEIGWEYLEEDSESFSVGFSKETLKASKEEDMDLISVMADVSKQNKHFGKMDKENLILNHEGIPVLCARS